MIPKVQFYNLLSDRVGANASYILHPVFEESLTRSKIWSIACRLKTLRITVAFQYQSQAYESKKPYHEVTCL